MFVVLVFFFFFKQKTAYEMRISDWSSDVCSSDLSDNICLLAAFADQIYANRLGCQTRAVFAYDERLRLLPDYLQQLEMESNGKSVTFDGQPLAQQTAPITWGGVGTDAQHAVFQQIGRAHV